MYAAGLAERVAQCEQAGLSRDKILVDPGFGFGKTVQQNMQLLGRLDEFAKIGCPLLIGVSRKSSLGAITGQEVDDRLPASLAAATAAVLKGASVVRAHDVAATVDAVTVAARLLENSGAQ